MSIQVGRANGKGVICAEELVKIQAEKLKELSKKFKGCRCSKYCSVWNDEGKDCELMGDYHLSPSRCRWFLMRELKSEETK
jgi:hypothetical protein